MGGQSARFRFASSRCGMRRIFQLKIPAAKASLAAGFSTGMHGLLITILFLVTTWGNHFAVFYISFRITDYNDTKHIDRCFF